MIHVHFKFFYCSGKGRIVDTYATDFTALESNGEIAVEIENTGDITADYTVRLYMTMRP